jgi:IS5 family transposase
MRGRKHPQNSFGDWELSHRVPKEHFLLKINARINWQPCEELLAPLYHPSLGRPSHPPLVMFKALLLQRWYDLSDPGLEEAIRDRLSFLRFLGLSLHDPVPDETCFCRFRGALADKGLAERLFKLLEQQLEALGLLVRRGTLIDATLVQAHNRPGTPTRPSVDGEAAWVRQGKKSVFGYKAHVAVDQESGLVRRLALTPANVPETLSFEAVLPGDEAAVFADRAYDRFDRRADLRRRGVFCGILARPSKRPLSAGQRLRNRLWERVRRAIERVHGTFKRHYGLARFFYVGLKRNLCHVWLVGICYNLKKMLVLQQD